MVHDHDIERLGAGLVELAERVDKIEDGLEAARDEARDYTNGAIATHMAELLHRLDDMERDLFRLERQVDSIDPGPIP